MQSKKLIYVLNTYSSKDSSHFHHVLGLLEALAARGIEIALVIEKADSIPSFSSTKICVVALHHHYGIWRFLELFFVIVNLIRKGFSRTYVRIAAPAALIAALAHRIFGGSAFLWQSGTTLEYDLAQPMSITKIKWYVGSYFPSVLARRFVHYFVTGPAFMVDYYSRVAGIKREKIRLLYNDIDISRFAPPADRAARKASFLQERGLELNTLVLLLVHRLSPVRRTHLYFPACLAHLRDAGLMNNVIVVVAGTGPELPLIQEEVKNYGISERCYFMGSIPNREIQQLYSIADIFLHPTYNEGFPRVVLEAMAAGLPIVSTNAGGTNELLGQMQSSFVVSKDDPQAFSDCLMKMVVDSTLRNHLASENLNHVERFATDKIAAMYDEVLFS